MTKEEFKERCDAQMRNITDPKRMAALRCKAGKHDFKSREIKSILKRKLAEQKAREDAKSKL